MEQVDLALFQTNPRGVEARRAPCGIRSFSRFRRTFVGLKHNLLECQNSDSSRFRRTFVGLKRRRSRITRFRLPLSDEPLSG